MTIESVFPGRAAGNIPLPGGVSSGFQFSTTGEDNLRLRSWCSVANVTIGIQGRQLRADGSNVPFGFTHLPTSDRLEHTTFHALDAGAILNVGVFIGAGAVQRGECFVELALVRGLSGATYFLGTLLQGYIGTVGALAWPGSVLEHPTDGRGVIKNSGIEDPATGEVLGTVPANTLWRVLMVGALYSSNAFGGVRQSILVFDDGAMIYMRSPQKQTQNPSEQKFYHWAPGLALETVMFNTIGVAGLPNDSLLLPGHRIRTITSGGNPTEGYGSVRIWVEEWIRP